MKSLHVVKIPILILLLSAIVSGCSSDEEELQRYQIGGTVTGLSEAASVVLQNNGGDDLLVANNGSFIFSQAVTAGGTYDVTVFAQPTDPSQTCTVTEGNGVAVQQVDSILVTCVTNTFFVGGTVTGLEGSGLVLQNNNGDDLPISADGSFAFTTAIASGAGYNVTAIAQPTLPSQTCTVSGANGSVAGQNIQTIGVSCTTNTYTIGGTVTGLMGAGLVLQNNGGDDLSISADGVFTFATALLSGSTYQVNVLTEPSAPNQTCAVINGTGDVVGDAITSVVISCSTFRVGVVVSGLETGAVLTLQNNGVDDLIITGNGGPYVFSSLVHDLTPYNVTISSQPITSTQRCLVVNGAGTIASAEVLDIAVVCPNVTALYPVNGANWNDYVNYTGNDGFSLVDSVCDGLRDSYTSCLHGGELREVFVDGVQSCTDIIASDDLNAFNWRCAEKVGGISVISTSLRKGASLSTLIDFSIQDWRTNSVTIYQSANMLAKTPSGIWWNNPIVAANAGGSLFSEGSIFIITLTPYANYSIDANKIGVVVQPGVDMVGAGVGAAFYANGYQYLWFEGKIDGVNNSNSILWENVTNSVIRSTQVSNLQVGGFGNVILQNSRDNIINGLRIGNSPSHGLVLNNSSYNTAIDVISTNSGNSGIYLVDANNNNFTGLVAAHNDNGSSSDGGGVRLIRSADNRFINATIVSNRLSGIDLSESPNNIFMNVLAVNNYTSFLIANNSNETTTLNLVAANNSRHGILVGSASNNYFTGVLKIGGNTDVDCLVEGTGVAPGVITASCTDTGIDGSNVYSGQLSDATLKTGINISGTFVGKVVIDDIVNISDINGSTDLATITDWVNFENRFRSWGLDGDSYPSINSQGPFPSCDIAYAYLESQCIQNGGVWRTDGRIWDWRLDAADAGDGGMSVAHHALVIPTGEEFINHSWSDTSSSGLLRNANEIMGDLIGNDDGLCNTNEECVFTHNIGAYQGDELVPAAAFVDSARGGITGVKLYQYTSSGK